MVGNEAITTAHPTQIRLVKEGSGSRQPRRSMRVVETGRSIPATAEPEGTVVRDDDIRQLPERNTESEGAAFGETDVRQLPDLSDRERRRNNSAEIIERKSRKRKFPSEPVELNGLLRRSKRTRKIISDNEFEYY